MALKRRKQEIRPERWAAARSRNAPEAVLGDLIISLRTWEVFMGFKHWGDVIRLMF